MEGTRNPSNNGGAYVPSPARDYAAEAAAQQAAIAAQQAQQAQKQRLSEAHNANERGNALFKKGDLAKAVHLYEEAARKSPNDKIIRANLAQAQRQLQTQRAAAEQERVAKQRDKTAASNMQRAINTFAETLNAAPASSGGLDFDGRNSGTAPGGGGGGRGLDFISPVPTTRAARLPAALEFGDPMVVNAQNVPSGLPKSVEDAIPHTPSGDRVRKGFQAITGHDWKVALAWFQDALNHEPGDPGLQRLVDLAQFTLDYRPPAQTTQLPNQNSTIKSTDDAVGKPGSGSLDQTIARQIAARARVDALYENGEIERVGRVGTRARADAVSKALNGVGYSKEELDAQFQKALADYLKHKSHAPGVGGSPAVNEVIVGGKG